MLLLCVVRLMFAFFLRVLLFVLIRHFLCFIAQFLRILICYFFFNFLIFRCIVFKVFLKLFFFCRNAFFRCFVNLSIVYFIQKHKRLFFVFVEIVICRIFFQSFFDVCVNSFLIIFDFLVVVVATVSRRVFATGFSLLFQSFMFF